MGRVMDYFVNAIHSPEFKKAAEEGKKISINYDFTTNELTTEISDAEIKDHYIEPDIEISNIPDVSVPEVTEPSGIEVKVEKVSFGFSMHKTEDGSIEVKEIDGEELMNKIQDKFKNFPWMR